MTIRTFAPRVGLLVALSAALLLPASTPWAGTGAVRPGSGYTIAGHPLDDRDPQYTVNDYRTYVIAGCVPKHLPIKGPVGSVWVACNDLDYAKEKVVESRFVSCLEILPGGVLQGLFIKEVNNRTWESFRFSCRELQADGTVGSRWEKSPFLFNYEKEGTLFETTVPTSRLSIGLYEVYNKLQLRESLLQVGLEHATAEDIHENGGKGQDPQSIQVSPRVPDAFGLGGIAGTHKWDCPPGMVVTGAAIGHVPDKKGKHTRPVYLLMECRKLFHG